MNHESSRSWSQTMYDDPVLATPSSGYFTDFFEADSLFFDGTSGLEDAQPSMDTLMGDLHQAPSSLTAQRQATANLPNFELSPPLNHQYATNGNQRFHQLPNLTGAQSNSASVNLGSLLTPPSNTASDSVSPVSSSMNSGNTSSSQVLTYTPTWRATGTTPASSRTEIASREPTMLLPTDIRGETTLGTRVGASEQVSLHPDQISPTSSHTFNQNTQLSTVAMGPYPTQSPQNTSSASFAATVPQSLNGLNPTSTGLYVTMPDGSIRTDMTAAYTYPVFGGDKFNPSPNAMEDDFLAWLFDETQSAALGHPSAASVMPDFNDNVIVPFPSPSYSKSPNDFRRFETGAVAQNNKPGVVPYRRHSGTLSKSPDDEKGVVDLGQRRSPFLREGRLFDLPLLLGGREILAVPDTGAQINAISVQTLKGLQGQFQSQWGSLDDVVNVANSSSTDAICQVTIHCQLAQTSLVAQYYQSCVFHVFSELASGVMAIMGRAFLDAAQILTTRSYLLRERVDHLRSIPRCMSIGPLKSSGLRLPVYLDLKLITAFPDTGSEIDLISRACALLHRFDIQQLQATDKSAVQFADGQIDTLSGKVRVKFDTFTEPALATRSMLPTKRDEPAPLLTPSSKRRKTSGTTYLDVASSAPPDHHRTFYVLDSLPYDVVLSQSLLHSIDAFNLHASGFTTVTPEENKKEICTVFWYRGKEYKAEETLQECQQREAARLTKVRIAREKIEKKIQKIPASDIVCRDQLRRDLEELRRQNEEEKEKYNAEVQALLTSSSTREIER